MFHRWKEKGLKREAKWQHNRDSQRQAAFFKLLLCICIMILGHRRARERVGALLQAFLRPTMYSMVEHTWCGYSMGMGMHSVGQLQHVHYYSWQFRG